MQSDLCSQTPTVPPHLLALWCGSHPHHSTRDPAPITVADAVRRSGDAFHVRVPSHTLTRFTETLCTYRIRHSSNSPTQTVVDLTSPASIPPSNIPPWLFLPVPPITCAIAPSRFGASRWCHDGLLYPVAIRSAVGYRTPSNLVDR
jgi:hypothetical protein